MHYYDDWLGRNVKKKSDIITLLERPYTIYENTCKNCYSFHDRPNLPNIDIYWDCNTDTRSSVS